MTKLILLLCSFAIGYGQTGTFDTLKIIGGAPASVTNGNTSIVGASGVSAYYYWIVAKYPIGNAFPYGPVAAFSAPATLSVGNYVVVRWNAMANATGYDVLRTSTPISPNGSCNCAVTLNTSSTSVNDQGAALSAYTISSAGQATGTWNMDNISQATALIKLLGSGIDFSGALVTKPNLTGSGAPVGSCLTGATYQRTDAAELYVCIATVWTALGTIAPSAAGDPNQYLRRTPNVPTTSYDFTSPQQVYSAQYNFSFTNGGYVNADLSATGSKTLTFAPCPLGVAGANTNHRLRISGGVGTAEQVTITGGTCTSGAASGTITVTTTNTHTGAWTVASATAGIQEAVKVVEALANGGSILLPQGNMTVYATTTLTGVPAVGIYGSGMWGSSIILDSSVTSGDILYCPGTTCLVRMSDFTVAGHSAHASGAAVHIRDSTSGLPAISNVRTVNTFGGFHIDNSDYVVIVNGHTDQDDNTNANYGVLVSGGSSDIEIIGGRYAAPEINVASMLDYGIRVTGADGLSIVGVMLRANEGLSIFGDTGTTIGTVLFADGIIDRCRTVAIAITVQAASTPNFFGNIKVSDSHIMGSTAMVDTRLIAIDTQALGAGVRSGIKFEGNLIANGNQSCFLINQTSGITIQDNDIINCNAVDSGSYSGIDLTGGENITISNNNFMDTNGSPKMDYAVLLSGTIDGLVLTGNNADNIAINPYNNGATLTNAVYGKNRGADNVLGAITAAGTVTVAPYFYPQFAISGTTTINTINGFVGTGDTRKFFCPNALTFSAAGNIHHAITTTVAGQVVTCTYNTGDSKWYCQ